ncbi:MAG TPA: PilZ domain-containing protein [Candidatus Sulfotelmatobacter sp.]|nr:PilZ domain-containing protein [Candidatus Sulfotelmatobacter sp.]
MTLSSMVVSRDWLEVSVLECILGGLHMEVAVENEPQKAIARLSKSKIDALIVDCDLNGSCQLLRELQAPQKQPSTVPLVIMGGPKSVSNFDETGALFAFEKPISVEQAVRTLSAARNMIVDGRLRYHRTGIEVPVSVTCKGKEAKQAHLVNVSQGGLQVHTDHFIDADTVLQVHFELPGARAAMKTQARVVWRDNCGNFGMRFLNVSRPHQRTLQLWLAQQFLAN